jgi:two-component system, OmpR family, sensor kinase
MPIRWRLTVFNVLVIGTILMVLGASSFLLVREAMMSEVEDTVRDSALAAARTVGSGNALNKSDVEQLTLDGVFVTIRDGEGRVLFRTVGLAPEGKLDEPFWRRAVKGGEPAGGAVDLSSGGRGYVYAVPIDTAGSEALHRAGSSIIRARPSASEDGRGDAQIVTPYGAARVIEAGKSYGSATATLRNLGAMLFAGVLAVLFLSAGGAYLLARAALAPVDAVVNSARGITEGSLSRRLPVRNAEDEIGRLAATINELLARLEVAFARQQEAMARQEEALARQRRFVADASHELRTPLTSISGYAALLERKGLRDQKVARASAKAIRRSSQRMENLVEGLLCLAGGDEGAPMDPRYQDLGAVAAEAVRTAQAATQGKVSIQYLPPAGPVRANFDRTRIEQALAILLDNAVKYTPQGGRVTVSVSEHDSWVNLEVSDTGVGISRDQIPFIFERFYRADEARNTAGAGLGLSIAWQIAEAHGGTIAVESKLDQGSIFAFRMPAGEAGLLRGVQAEGLPHLG